MREVLLILLAIVLPSTAAGAGITDPTRPATWSEPGRSASAQPEWRLTMVRITDAGERLAWINGTPVAVGDRIEGARVEELSMRSARLSWRGETIELELPHGIRQETGTKEREAR